MRRPSAFTERRTELEIAMTPMIDVVFLLLVFFVWTASFQIVEHVLPSNLSAATGSQPSPNDPPPPEKDFDDVVVRIRGAGAAVQFSLNDQELADIEQLAGQLKLLARIKTDAPIIVHPDPTVPMSHVVEVYDRARQSGFVQVQFATSEPL